MVEVGGKIVEQFAQNLRQLIADGATAAPAEAGAEAGAGGAATAEEGADADPSPGDQARTSASPAAAPSAAATSTASAPQAAAPADSINLVRLVGPSILKRAIPVAAGLAVLALIGLRVRHIFRRDAKE
jgi:hypothetical protein